MFFNDFRSAKAAGLVSVTLVKAAESADDHQLIHIRKRYNPHTGFEVTSEIRAFTPAELKAEKEDLTARIAEINALLADVTKMKIALAPVEEVIPK